MDHFAGLDVSVKETSVCIVDDTGRVVKEVKAASEPQALLKVLGNPAYRFKRIGLEAGPLSQWLFSGLAEAGLPVVCVETRHMQAVLKAQINKTDRNDARGIAQMMRVGLYRPVHVKTLRSQKLRMLLTHRKLLQSKAIAIENDLRGTLRNFGLKVLEGDGAATRTTLAVIEYAKERFSTAHGLISRIIRVMVAPGSVTYALMPLRMAKKLDPHRETARMVLEPWLVEAALAQLPQPLSPADQRIIVKATRTPHKVRWPEWWSEHP